MGVCGGNFFRGKKVSPDPFKKPMLKHYHASRIKKQTIQIKHLRSKYFTRQRRISHSRREYFTKAEGFNIIIA